MKKMIALALCLMVLFSMTIPAASADDLQGEIVFWHSFTQGPRLETLQKIADDFMAIHPGVKITMETFSWGDFYTK